MMTDTFRCVWLWSGHRGMDSNEVLDRVAAKDEFYISFLCARNNDGRYLTCDTDTT